METLLEKLDVTSILIALIGVAAPLFLFIRQLKKDKLAGSKDAFQAAMRMIEQLQEDTDGLRKRIEVLEAQHVADLQRIEVLETQRGEAKRAADELSRLVVDLQAQLDEKRREIQALNDDLKVTRQALEDATVARQDRLQRIKELEHELVCLRDKVDNMEKKHNGNEQEKGVCNGTDTD